MRVRERPVSHDRFERFERFTRFGTLHTANYTASCPLRVDADASFLVVRLLYL